MCPTLPPASIADSKAYMAPRDKVLTLPPLSPNHPQMTSVTTFWCHLPDVVRAFVSDCYLNINGSICILVAPVPLGTSNKSAAKHFVG